MVVAPPRSVRQEQRELAATLRAESRTWAEIAAVFRDRYRVNARVAVRLARGWSQREAAEQWNDRWPAEAKTFKSFSYWEQWPARTGHAPSLDVLTRLAEVYGCALADLVVDCADHRALDEADNERARDGSTIARVRGTSRRAKGTDAGSPDGLGGPLHDLAERVAAASVDEIVDMVAGWRPTPDGPAEVNRRAVLLKLSAALSLAATQRAEAAGVEAGPGGPAGGWADLAGVWRSRYTYPSTGRARDLEGEHYLVLRQRDGRWAGQSLPHSQDSRLRLELSVASSIATGTWTEHTAPGGYYQGASYHGTLQLVIGPTGRAMTGKWLGFGKDGTVNTGVWDLTWVDAATNPAAVRAYHRKA